uniref:Calcineurin-like phosphoesterase n=1 Tax=viral metagenome TaxID=1070528 RepID=A0A6M3LG50_9ZZZZ
MRKSKYIVIASDQHSGHIIGLTPPKWFKTGKKKLAKYEARLWKFYKELLKELPRIDHVIVNGDLVDGKQNKTKGLELITTNVKEQCEIAAQSIIMLGANTVEIIRGTRYHVGQDEDYEDQVLPMLREQGYKSRELGIQDHGYFEIGGIILDIKHKISNAQLPHTKGTPLGREKLQNLLWYEHGEIPLAKIIVRSHVHNYCHLSGWNGRVGEWHSITTPALQGLGGSYGVRECSQTIDWGLILIEITPKGNVKIDPLIRLTRYPEELVKKL